MPSKELDFGVLLPVFSLPGEGTLDGAESFVAFLAASGAAIWQVLPLGPTHEDGSPYLSLSAHAGNPRLIGMRSLSEEAGAGIASLEQGYDMLGALHLASEEYHRFTAQHRGWLDDFSLFCALRREQGDTPWTEWPSELRTRVPAALADAKARLAPEIDYVRWQQFLFFSQWARIRTICADHTIALFGDVPIYVSLDSADVWQHQELFQLNEAGMPEAVAGVPPDYFSPTGQRWGNPLYDWARLASDGYEWWIERMSTQRCLFDLIRIDHFRGLESYWEIPGNSPTAETGCWRKGPGRDFLRTILDALPDMRIVAEDLGTITQEVDALRGEFALPGIRVLQFGFDGVRNNPHNPDNLEENMVLYTGTHDNDTSVGWHRSLHGWQRDLVDASLARFDRPFPFSLIECAFASPARTVIVPLQDLLALGSDARTNTPGTTLGNWQWQLPGEAPLEETVRVLLDLKQRYDR